MTNEEAIKILTIIRNTPSVDIFNKLPDDDGQLDYDLKSAFDLAIGALKYIINDTPKVRYNERWLAYQQRKPDNDGAEWRCNGAL